MRTVCIKMNVQCVPTIQLYTRILYCALYVRIVCNETELRIECGQ